LIGLMGSITAWAEQHLGDIEAARLRYDALSPTSAPRDLA